MYATNVPYRTQQKQIKNPPTRIKEKQSPCGGWFSGCFISYHTVVVRASNLKRYKTYRYSKETGNCFISMRNM